MSKVMNPSEYLETLETTLQLEPETLKLITEAKDAFNKRWWHEMATSLLTAATDSSYVRSQAPEIHLNVLIPCRLDIAPEIYVKLVYITVSQMADEEAATNLLEGASNAILGLSGPNDQCYRSLQCIKALLLMANEASLEARRVLDGVEEFAKGLQTHEVSYVLQAFLHKGLCRQYELLSEFTKYYATVFDLVTYSEKGDIPISKDEMGQLAYKTALACLLSPSVHNFGRLLTTQPFVDALEGSNDAWLLEWVRICNAGDVSGYESFVKGNKAMIESIPDVAKALPNLSNKVRLMALLHLVFHTPPNQRTFTFEQIAKRCSVDEANVGLLLLNALSLKIIEGTIDGLQRSIEVSWVQARVLSLEEVRGLAEQIRAWRTSVKETAAYVEELAKEIPQ